MMHVEVQDTVIPTEFLPLIVLQRLHDDYYGGYFTVLEMRRFLEPRLRNGLWTRGGVVTWIRKAIVWKYLCDQDDPEYVPRLLEEYHSIRAIA